ncbi:MAG: hypothetical protein EBX52_03430 [Proteobacteria bacterium]|nr:hypothetical protein [Pseudomonadota bacterium]
MRKEQGGSNEVEPANTATIPVEPEGSVVLQEVVRMTGLSEDYLDTALSGLLGKPDASVNELTMDELRSLLLECLESLNEQISLESEAVSKIN